MGEAPPPALGLRPVIVGVAAAPAVDEGGALLGGNSIDISYVQSHVWSFETCLNL